MLAFGWGLVTVSVLSACGSSREPARQEATRSAAGAAGSGSAAGTAGSATGTEPGSPAGDRPVNLLTAAPVIVAVSSTVANREIVPAHLVDGDLGTAWNSRTGELQGAWIGARVPADARVTAIRMTVGFTKVDPKLGDLFTMNPRIRKVRVLRNGAPIAERALDPAVRTLQDIAIDQPGGEYKIEVVDILPGSKTSWREICVSELEIWGMPGPGTTAKPSAPVVYVGSFDPPPAIAPADCVAAMFPAAKGDGVVLQNGPEVIGNVEVTMLADALAVCRVERTRERTERWSALDGDTEVTFAETTIELAPVTRPRLTAGDRIVAATNIVLRDIKLPPGSAGVGDVDHKESTVARSRSSAASASASSTTGARSADRRARAARRGAYLGRRAARDVRQPRRRRAGAGARRYPITDRATADVTRVWLFRVAQGRTDFDHLASIGRGRVGR